MLLTVNGEADNGKDFVADWCSERFGLVKIAFADPMKRFVRQLFGLDYVHLWGPSEKRNELLPAGPIWSMALSQLHTMHQFTAAVVPESLGPDVRAKAFAGLQDWFTTLRRQYGDEISARIILQTLGTEWGREVDPKMWLNYLFGNQLPLLAQGFDYVDCLGVRTNVEPGTPKNGICIPDQRFVNELEESELRGGYSIRARRLSRVRKDSSNIGLSGHKSELEQRGIPDERFNKVFNFEEGLDLGRAQLEAWAQTQEPKQ